MEGQDDHADGWVRLHAYDLMQRIQPCNALNQAKDQEVWYSGIVAFGKEYAFSQAGIESTTPGETLLGEPDVVENIGHTELPFSIFLDFVLTLGETKYRSGTYNIQDQNGNSFTDEVAQFVCGVSIPQYLFRVPHVSSSNWPAGEEAILQILDRVSERGTSIVGCGQRSQTFLFNYVPKDPRGDKGPIRETSPDLEELQAQIDAIKANHKIREARLCEELNGFDKDILLPDLEEVVPGRPLTSSSYDSQKFTDTCPAAGVAPKGDHSDIVSGSPPSIASIAADRGQSVQSSSSSEEGTPPVSNRSSGDIRPTAVEQEGFQFGNLATESEYTMAEPAVPVADVDGGEGLAEKPKKSQKPKEPPITFREFDHTKEFEDLVRTVVTKLNVEEQDRLREMEDWIIKDEGTWVLAEGFNAFLGRVLSDSSLPSQCRVSLLRLLAYGTGQDDFVLILHMDRKDHVVMNYAQGFDRLPVEEQEALALLFANLFETNSASEWLLYISEWKHNNRDISNIWVTTKVAVNSLLGSTPTLQDYGTAIMHNLGTKEVFDDMCAELTMAILQFLQGKPSEEQVFRCLKGLAKFCQIAHRDVPQLIKMIGPDPAMFGGMSARVDALLTPIAAKLATVPSF